MENITRNVDELAAPQRKTIEDLLGHQLANNQQVFIMAFDPGTITDDEVRNAARLRLQTKLLQSQRNGDSSAIAAQEADAVVDEVIEVIRPRPKP